MNVELRRDDFSIDGDESSGELLQVGNDDDESPELFYLETGPPCNARLFFIVPDRWVMTTPFVIGAEFRPNYRLRYQLARGMARV